MKVKRPEFCFRDAKMEVKEDLRMFQGGLRGGAAML